MRVNFRSQLDRVEGHPDGDKGFVLGVSPRVAPERLMCTSVERAGKLCPHPRGEHRLFVGENGEDKRAEELGHLSFLDLGHQDSGGFSPQTPGLAAAPQASLMDQVLSGPQAWADHSPAPGLQVA